MANATVTGVDRLKAKLAAIPASVRDEWSDALAGSAADLVAFQRRLASSLSIDDKGELASSIRWDWAGKNGDRTGLRDGRAADIAAKGQMNLAINVTAGNRRVWWAHFFEWGTRSFINKGLFAGTKNPGIQAQPFFFPPYRASRKNILARLAAAGRRGIKKIAQ